jgi:hypothetical protein
MRVFTAVAISAAMWTTGPSRPVEPPLDSVMSEASAEPSPRRTLSRPS